MSSFLTGLNIIIGILLTTSILLQHRASGLSATFGGTGTSYVQRRGSEQVLYLASIWLGVAFFVIPVLQWYVY